MSTCLVCPVYGRDGEDGRPAPRYVEQGWLVCTHCQPRTIGHLAEIPVQYSLLDATQGTSPAEARISGSTERSLGVRESILDLIVTTPDTDGVHAWTENNGEYVAPREERADQIGQIPVARVLDSWVKDWIATKGQRENRPVPTVERLCVWLTHRWDWACQHYLAVDDFAREIRSLNSALLTANGNTKAVPEHKVGVPCPRCDYMTLYRQAGDDYVECGTCPNLLTPDEYDRWVKLYAAGHTWSEAA